MNGKDIIGYLVKLLEEQEQIKITYSLGGTKDDELERVCSTEGYELSRSSRGV
jgi:hypothetical protein